MRPPWTRDWLQLTPEAFETLVITFLGELGAGLKGFEAQHRSKLPGPDGEFEIDAAVHFDALGGNFLVLVECKHHRSPIKRDAVLVLREKVRSAGAHKGMLFSTAPFQKGAIEYAQSQGVALIHFTEGGPVFETRGMGERSAPNRHHDAYFVSLNEGGDMSYRSAAYEEISQFLFGAHA